MLVDRDGKKPSQITVQKFAYWLNLSLRQTGSNLKEMGDSASFPSLNVRGFVAMGIQAR
jgi:hypothetical protein